jgi:hypothetical protein
MTARKRRRRRKRKREGARVVFEIYVDADLPDRFERIAVAFEQKLPRGARITRADAARAALNVGVEFIERDLGLIADRNEATD